MQKKIIRLKSLKKALIFALVLLFIYTLITYDKVANILAGIAILLIGMNNLSSGFKNFSGGLLESILKQFTNTSAKSILFGTLSTVVMQSSSLVCVLSLSFLSAGLITLTQGIGILFGANLGNSAGSWLIALISGMKIAVLALPLLISGVLLFFMKDTIYKALGQIFIGIGFFFLGVDYIKGGFEHVKELIDLARFDFEGFRGILIFTALGALLTGIIQSSHATIALIIAALTVGQISYENALAATLGTSVGGVVTALLAALSTSIEGKKLALANCIFNFGIALIILPCFSYCILCVDFIAELLGISSAVLKIAIFHSFFNLIAVLIFGLGMRQIANFLNKNLKSAKENKDRPLYLDPNLTPYPDTALEALKKESEHLYDNVCAIIAHTLGFSRKDIRSSTPFKELIQTKKWFKKEVNLGLLYQNKIKILFEAIMDFSAKVQIPSDGAEQHHRIFTLKLAAKNLAEASKNLTIIQANIKKYSLCDNPNLALEYNTIRSNMAELLRSVEELRKVDDERAYLIIKNFAKAKEILKEVDHQTLGKIESLLVAGKINTAESISILNDTTFIAKIAGEIIEAVEIIFSKEGPKA
ncbi:Na/Pi symporter [Campylobacter sp.]|uniref:Na/Pi cotransporter family protein n=1 Tax=Campylobacter sp. TaxID=205 RepID=UPI0026DAE222|nr:Na/Pi symporter [Campylobacter sp.]MDO4673819.1 Na/Pi symporter [Campylobacter sp.]